MDFIDFLGHVGCFFIAVSLYMLARKNHYGALVNAFGCSFWLYNGTQLGLTSCVLWNFVFIVLNIQGFRKSYYDGQTEVRSGHKGLAEN